MRINSAKIFSWFFITVISFVAILQAVVELSKKEPVQSLAIFTDTFITPFVSIAKNNTAFKKVITELDSISNYVSGDLDTDELNDKIALHSEAAQLLLEDIRRSMISVNRYNADSSSGKTVYIDSLITDLKNIDTKTQNNEPIDIRSIDGLKFNILNTQRKILPSGFAALLLPFQHFFKYTVFNQKYLRSYEKEMEKNSIVASTVRPVVQFVRFSILKDYGDKAIAGKNGWLFYKPDVEYLYRPSVDDPRSQIVDYNDKSLSDDPLAIITDFKNQLSSMGIELLVVIVPGKPSIYPDLIGNIPEIDTYRKFSHSLKFLQQLRHNGVDVVDLFQPFLEERKNDTRYGDSLYLQRDTHWKPRGAMLASEIVSREIKKKSWYSEDKRYDYIIDTVEVQRIGDVGAMTKLTDFNIGKLQVAFPAEKTKCYQVYSVVRDDSGTIISKNLYKDDYRKSNILILGDSFSRIYQTDEPRGAGWISHLAYRLGEPVASIVNDGGASTIVRQILERKKTLLKNKKLVIWEFVERDLRFGDMGWKKIDFTANSKE